MRSVCVLGLVWLATSLGCVTDDALTGETDQAIENGAIVAYGEHPSVVKVGDNRHPCTGTLIDETKVLTAAHCVCPHDVPGTTLADCAETTIVQLARVYQRPFAYAEIPDPPPFSGTVTVHPEYDPTSHEAHHDMAVITLDERPNDTYFAPPVEVEFYAPQPGDTVTLVGFGGGNNDCSEGSKYGTKRVTNVPVAYLDYRPYGNVEVIETVSSAGICPGDSGGPMLNGAGRVVGVASWKSGDTSHHGATFAEWEWLSDNACDAFDPTHRDAAFCANPLCPCQYGAGDCDGSAQCRDGLECIKDRGAEVGLPASWDVCMECPEFDPTNPHAAFCDNPGCPCSFGEGDCDYDYQCAGSMVCVKDVGASFGLPASWDVCMWPLRF